MLKFNKNVEERKTVATRLGELTGIQPFYTRTPHYAYEVGPYTIDREGNLLVDENQADADVLTSLMSEGLITGGEVIGTEAAEAESNGPEMNGAEGAGLEETELQEGANQQVTDDDSEESREAPGTVEAQEEEPDTEPSDEAAPDGETESAGEADPFGETPTEEVDMDMNFTLPIGRHSGTTLRNLVNLIYSRGPLISKATGGYFNADEGLVETLKDDSCTYTKANFLTMLSDYEAQHGEALRGVKISENEVSFTGFGRAEDMDNLTAYGHLAVLMNDQALTQKRIQAKHVNDSNEKYAMRIWLVRIGMGGAEFKKTRAILMKNLGGHTAFRTPEDAQKAKEKAQRQRDALKAAKLAAQGGATTGGENDAVETSAPAQPTCGADTAQMLEAGA